MQIQNFLVKDEKCSIWSVAVGVHIFRVCCVIIIIKLFKLFPSLSLSLFLFLCFLILVLRRLDGDFSAHAPDFLVKVKHLPDFPGEHGADERGE